MRLPSRVFEIAAVLCKALIRIALQTMAIIYGVAPDFDPVEVRAYIESHAPPPCSMVGRLHIFGDVERDLHRTSRLNPGFSL
jgi:hypothetical protein